MSKNASDGQEINPEPLQLSLNPTDGSLLSAPLLSVLLAETNGIYNDIFNMAHGEINVTTALQQEDAVASSTEDNQQVIATTHKSERMANLSFVQRRHELSWRLGQHSKSLQHLAALTASAATSDFSHWVDVSSRAMQHARSSWVQADEAQDALFFFHAQLFPARAAPHDVYGALDVQLKGMWYDLPTDLRLTVDRYDTSAESQYSKEETNQRWKLAVRDKLLRGEVGWMRQQGTLHAAPWKLALRGGVVRLTHGMPKARSLDASTTGNPKLIYPIEAVVNVLSTNDNAPWTLLSVEVNVQAKTGEFNHQLETSNRQRYDLHRICARAMALEEMKYTQSRENETELAAGSTDEEQSSPVARPLDALFRVAHVFSLSWQLELLSAQALALRRGVWAAGEGNQITITPVRFFDGEGPVIGVVSVSFWKIDDSFGPPSMTDLTIDNEDGTWEKRKQYADTSGQLVLSIRAERAEGMKVSLSGADGITSRVSTKPTSRERIRCLLNAVSNPFELSASDALLAATHLCAERKCAAVVSALVPNDRESLLPEWINLSLDGGNIVVEAKLSYKGVATQSAAFTPMFRLLCDARTGTFVCTFSKEVDLLRRLVSNDVCASEALALRVAAAPQHRKRVVAAASTGRVVRDAFESLVRSMNQLGQRSGVGFTWDNRNDEAASLRQRSIHSSASDVVSFLERCCGICVLYGVFVTVLTTVSGVDVLPDRCGQELDDESFLPVPPVGIIVEQQISEKDRKIADGTHKKHSCVIQKLFCGSCSVSKAGVELIPMIIRTKLASPSSIPERTGVDILEFKEGDSARGTNSEQRPGKRARSNGSTANDAGSAIENLCSIIAATLDTLD